jgi:hypothetical protein
VGGGTDPGGVHAPGCAPHCPAPALPNCGPAFRSEITSEMISAGKKQKKPNRNHNTNERPLCDAMAAGMSASATANARKTKENVPEYERPLTV